MKSILFTALYLLYIAVLIEAKPTELEGDVPSMRIYGGQKVDNIGDYPWQVSFRMILSPGRFQHFCGGAIISNQHILTAAHCFLDHTDPTSLRKRKVFTGTSRLDVGGEAHSIKQVIIHPRMNRYTLYNDIAIVTLVDSIEFNSRQNAINLPTRNIVKGAIATVSGWGNTDETGRIPIHLQEAKMRLIPTTECKHELHYALINSQICAISRPRVAACFGDSGSGLVAKGQLVGLVSRGGKDSQCASNNPDIYTNVYSFINFIKQNIYREG